MIKIKNEHIEVAKGLLVGALNGLDIARVYVAEQEDRARRDREKERGVCSSDVLGVEVREALCQAMLEHRTESVARECVKALFWAFDDLGQSSLLAREQFYNEIQSAALKAYSHNPET